MLLIAKETFKLAQWQQQTRPVLVNSFVRINIHPIRSSLCFSYKKYHWTTKSVPETSKPQKLSWPPPHKKEPSKAVIKETSKKVQTLKHSGVSKHKVVKQFPKKKLIQSTSDIKEPEVELLDIVESSPKPFQLQVGDFVDVRRNGKGYIGIITKLSSDPTSVANKNEILLPNNHLLLTRSEDIVFKITGYAYNTEFNNSKLDFGSPIPETYAKLAANLDKSAQFLLHSKTPAFRQIHSQFADELENKKITIPSVAHRVFQNDNPTEAQLLATHMFLFKENIYFMADPMEIRQTGTYTLRSKRSANAITKVMEWIRLRDQRVTEFQEKATKIIQHIRSIDKNSSEPPSFTKEITLPEFTSNDQMFINLVKTFVLTPKHNQSGLEAHLSAILKPLKLYEGDFDRGCAIQFLKEIGVWAPWENLIVYEGPTKLSGHGVSKEADKEQEEIITLATNLLNSQPFDTSKNKSTTLPKSSLLIKTKDSLGENDFYPCDICEDIRHDFGDLPVYTIDDPTAHELDDGISIERVINSSGTESIWVHIHIADPSTYIHPGHRLAQIARSRIQTIYFPERNYSMLPSSLSEKLFSLGVDTEIRGNYVMTFSVRIGDDSSLLEYKVRPSIIRNVKTLYYDDIDKFLSWDSFSKIKDEVDFIYNQIYFHPYQIPVPNNARNVYKPLLSSAQQDLKDLQKIADIHLKGRKQKGYFSPSLPQGNAELSPFPLITTQPDTQYPVIFTGLPTIQVNLDKFNYSPARMMVAELMVMAGRVASIFCSERNIPIIFRTQAKKKDSAELDEILSKFDKDIGANISKVRSLMQPVMTTVEPGSHFSMGITEGYSKVTSPLRRYGDLLVHWQIKASLLNESLPFPKDELINSIPYITYFEKEIRRLQMKSNKFWILNLIHRLNANGNLPEITGIIIDELDKGDRTVLIREFGIQGKLTKSKGQLGDIIKLKVVNIMPNKHNIILEPL